MTTLGKVEYVLFDKKFLNGIFEKSAGPFTRLMASQFRSIGLKQKSYEHEFCVQKWKFGEDSQYIKCWIKDEQRDFDSIGDVVVYMLENNIQCMMSPTNEFLYKHFYFETISKEHFNRLFTLENGMTIQSIE